MAFDFAWASLVIACCNRRSTRVGGTLAAGFTADGSVENFKRRRQTELKHGRIAMLATMGYITPEQLAVQSRLWLACLLMLLSACRMCIMNPDST